MPLNDSGLIQYYLLNPVRTTNNIKFYKIVFNATLLMQGIKSSRFQPHFHARGSRDLSLNKSMSEIY